MKLTIFSGGQTGVDRAALDAAMDKGVPCGGWCPRGRRAEDGTIAAVYPLQESTSPDYSVRTEKNVADSDGTLLLHDGSLDQGTALTVSLCAILGKPLHEVDLSGTYNTGHSLKWIEKKSIRVLHVAGPRESHAPGIYRKTLKFMNILLKDLG